MVLNMDEFENLKESQQVKALSYLRARFPETEDRVFFTKYTGQVQEEVIQLWAVIQAAELEEICGKCEGKTCGIPEAIRAKNSRPIVGVSASPRGYRYLDVRWTMGLKCRYEQFGGGKGQMYQKSGLSDSCMKMTFKNYECKPEQPETRKVALEALQTAEDGTNLILSGKAGTGKTHLAVAIAIHAMEHGRQAIFRLVSTMLDEIQSAIRGNGDYDGLMRQFKTVPCLVLDDLGHENMTPARASYLHQIIDYRYVHKLQMIVTTNAKNIAELCNWDKEEYVMPMVSRILERGKWLTMKTTEDYRLKRGVDSDR